MVISLPTGGQVAPEVFYLDGAVVALDDAVGLRAASARADLREWNSPGFLDTLSTEPGELQIATLRETLPR